MRDTLKACVAGLALMLVAAGSLAAFIWEWLGPGRAGALIVFGSLFLMSSYPIAVVAAFLIHMSLRSRPRRGLPRKRRDVL